MGIAERKRREFERRERELLAAALELLGGERFQSVTVEQIAERAEIGKGTVYKHFESKDEIYGRLTVQFYEIALRKLRRVEGDVRQRMRSVIAALWETHRAHPEYHRILEYTTRSDFRVRVTPSMREQFDVMNEQLMKVYVDVLRDGVREGFFPPLPLEELLRGPSATLDGATATLWSGCLVGAPADEYIAQITDFIEAGLTHPARWEEPSRS